MLACLLDTVESWITMSFSGPEPIVFWPSRTRKSSPFWSPLIATNQPTTGGLRFSDSRTVLRPTAALAAPPPAPPSGGGPSVSSRVLAGPPSAPVGVWNRVRWQYGQISHESSIWCPLEQNFAIMNLLFPIIALRAEIRDHGRALLPKVDAIAVLKP